MSYYEKYLKYKKKYLNLVNSIGGGKQSAMDKFLAKYNEKVLQFLINDRSKGFLEFEGNPTKEKLQAIFEQIFKKVENDNKGIDWIIESYVTNTFGIPSSLENFGRYKEAMKSYNILYNNDKSIIPINQIKGLVELENFIERNKEKLKKIEEEKQKRNIKKGTMKVLKEKGEEDVVKMLETDKVIIYQPTTEDGSKYYGMNTKWCTTSKENNQFNKYNKQGPLYIIQSKSDIKDKYQLHIEKEELMNSKNDPVTINFIESTFNDSKLNDWFKKIFIDYIKKNKKFKIPSILYSYNIKNILEKVPELETLELFNYNDPLNDSLKGFTSLQTLQLYDYKHPLNDSLKGLTSLQTLELNFYDHPLNDSLKGLTSLQSLNLFYYNQPLNDLLKGLTSLQILNLDSYNHPLNDSLKGLTSLQTLILDYNQPLYDSLGGLTSLQNLRLYNYNHPLNDSLKGLTSLQTLNLPSYNQPLNDSLKGLTSLQTLNLAYDPTDEELKDLINLQELNHRKYVRS